MKKLLVIVVLIAVGFVLSYYFHWGLGFLSCLVFFLVHDFGQRNAALLGFISFAILWAGFAGFIDLKNGGLLSEQIGVLFGGLPSTTLVLITGLVGGIGGSLSAWLVTSISGVKYSK